MGKIKLTESQITMLQSFEQSLPNKKVIKITAEQYNRIFESENPHEFNVGPKPMRTSNKVTKNFRKFSKDVPDSNMKFENSINSAGSVDVIDFGQQVIGFLKRLLTDPSDERINKFWRDLKISKEELTKRMFELSMIGHGIINGKKIIKIMKNNFTENIKTLYGEYVPQNEGMMQMGDDVEMRENDKVNKVFSQPFEKKQGQARSPEMIKLKIKQKRKEELKRREAENNRPIGEDGGYPAGAQNDPRAPYNQVDAPKGRRAQQRVFDLLLYSGEFAIFEKDGRYFSFNVEGTGDREFSQYADRDETPLGRDSGGMMDVEYGEWEMTDEVVDNYVNDNFNNLNFGRGYDDYENGVDMVELDQEIIDEMLSSAKYMSNPREAQQLISILSNLTLGEVTAAAGSSGAFVGKMGMNAPITGVSPADEMKSIVGEHDEDHDEINAKLDGLKYKNFQHPALGVFNIDTVDNIHEDENRLHVTINLQRENGKPNSELIYSFDKKTGKDELIFNLNSEKFRNAYDMFDELYGMVFDAVKDVLRPTSEIQEQGIGNSGQYATPGFPASDFFGNKGKKGKAPVNKGVTHKKPMYPKGKILKVSENQMKLIKKMIVESNNQTDTAYPDGKFIEIDDCTKLNNNKKAQNGGCSTGAKDNVVKFKQTKDSVISDDALYSEVANKTGRTIAEVKNIIQRRKG